MLNNFQLLIFIFIHGIDLLYWWFTHIFIRLIYKNWGEANGFYGIYSKGEILF